MPSREQLARVVLILGLFVLHFGGYVGATESALLRPASAHWSFATRFDDRVPFLAWTWPFYWAAYPFDVLGGVAALLALPARRFRRAVAATAAMLITGASLQTAFPAHAPVPHVWHPAMELIHWAPFEKNFATFPSMHVALAVWTAALAQDAFKARWLRAAFVAVAACISVSTVTLHEHVLLDLVGGVALADVTALWYRRGGAFAKPRELALTAAPVEVVTVDTAAGRRLFAELPARLHRAHPLWVPPLLRDEERFMDPRRNPAFAYSDVTMALAFAGGEAVGRVMGIVNRRFNARSGERSARFSCLECPDDLAVAGALLAHVEAWARDLGMDRVVGPLGFTDQDPEGFLIEGLEHSPTVATCYNFEYLPRLVEGLGYEKDVDYVVYRVPVPGAPLPFHARAAGRLLSRGDLRVLEFARRRDLARWVRPILELMAETFADAYGFVAPDEKEMTELGRQWLPVLDPRFVKAVAHGDRLVGFIVAMPHLADGLRRAQGRLFPFGFLHVLLAARRTRQLDLLLAGVRREFRGRGVDAALGDAMLRSARAAGFEWLDSHHELESNLRVRREMERAGGRLYKRYRVYTKRLAGAEAPFEALAAAG